MVTNSGIADYKVFLNTFFSNLNMGISVITPVITQVIFNKKLINLFLHLLH